MLDHARVRPRVHALRYSFMHVSLHIRLLTKNRQPLSLLLKRSPYHPTLPLFDPSPNLYYYLHMFYFFKVSFPKGRIKAIDLHFRIFSFTGSRRVLVGESIFF